MALACLLTGDSLSLILTPLAQSAGSSVAEMDIDVVVDSPPSVVLLLWLLRDMLCSPRRRHGSALRRGVRDGVATVRETSRRSRRGVGGDGGGRSRRFSGGPALSAGLATRLSTRAIVPAVKIQKKGPLGLGRKRAVKTAGGGYYAPGAWNQVLFSDFFLPSGFSLVCPAFPETAFLKPKYELHI